MSDFFATLGWGVGYAVVWVMCFCGFILSGLSFSGTWLVLAATVIALFLSGDAFPGWITVGVMLVVCILVEIADFMAGAWGVKKRGGSGLAGVAALVGGLVGMWVGSFIPIMILGTLIGMFAGCFLGAYAVESYRLKEKNHAAHIATGALLARVMMLCFKLFVTVGMITALVLGVVLA